MQRHDIIGWAAAGILAVAWAPVAVAESIAFQPGELLQVDADALDVGDYAIPCAADWNGDGKKDLLVGYQTAGKIAVYINSGTDAQPAFTNAAIVQAGGADIQHVSSGCGSPAPWVCDYDGDGVTDLLVGAGATGSVYFYRNTNSNPATPPVLIAGVQLTLTNGSPVSVTYRATPYVTDWDEDGLNDLLCGMGDGYVYLFKNVGTVPSPSYAGGVRIQAGGVDLNLGIRSVVRVFDWDGDGVKDIVGSSNTGVYWCRNTGSKSAPVLQAPMALRAPVSGSGLQPIYTGVRMRLDLTDWNSDGATDLLVGNADGTITLYEGYQFVVTSAAAQPGDQVTLRWNSAPYLQYDVLAGPTVTNIVSLIATNLLSEGRSTAHTIAVAGGQQFYRIQIAP